MIQSTSPKVPAANDIHKKIRSYACYLFLGGTSLFGQAWSWTPQKVVIVGGGIGGLATAARIAAEMGESRDGFPPPHITILEKNPIVGGRSGSFDVSIPNYGIFRHEQGPSLLLLPHVYERLFQDCGSSANEYGLHMRPCNPAYQVVFDDGDRLLVGFRREGNSEVIDGEEAESRATMEKFEENGAQKWDAYLQACEAFLDCGLPNFIEEKFDLGSFPVFSIESLRDAGKAWPLKPHSDVLEAFFTSPKMRALASFQDLYVGLEPYRNNNSFAGGVFGTTAPAVFGLLAAIELHPENKKCGVFAPEGGFRCVSAAMEKLCTDLGVVIRCNQTVTSVSSSGVNIRGADDTASTFVEADLIVMNTDLPYAQATLLRNNDDADTETYDWTEKYKFSSGVIAFHWSTNKTLDELNTHNVFLQASKDVDAKESWSCLRETFNPPCRFSSNNAYNFYVHRPSKVDPSCAPSVRK